MELRISIVAFLLCVSSVAAQLNVNFAGDGMYPVGANATFSCQFSPIPDDLEEVEVSWWLSAPEPNKLAKSVIAVNGSFTYDTADPSLKSRFSTSSDRFFQGVADATIHSITISDESSYACDVEIAQLQTRTPFEIQVYQFPTYRIENINIDLDIRPVEEQPTEAQPESPTDVVDEMGNSTALNTTVEEGTNGAGGVEVEPLDPDEEPTSPEEPTVSASPEDGNVTIIHCIMNTVYPVPNKVTFRTTGANSDLEWVVTPENFYEVSRNGDGSYNVTARLRTEPTAELDGQAIACYATLTDRNLQTMSPPSGVISVKHSTTRAHLKIFPENIVKENTYVTITCGADGNPAPEIRLEKNGQPVPLTNGEYAFTATRQSSAMYSCIAVNSKGEVFHENEELKVHWMEQPVVTSPTPAEKMIEGTNVELQCSAASSEVVSYQWFKGSERLQGKNTEILRFTPLEVGDSGTYMCAATTTFHRKAQAYKVEVLLKCMPKLDITVTSSTVEGGNAYVSVTCTAEGKPACKMELSSFGETDATTLANKATLVIENMPKQEKAPEFFCSAKNDFSSGKQNKTIDADLSELVCCKEMSSGGLGTGIIIIIVVVAILAVIAALVACYMLRKRKSENEQLTKDEQIDDAEAGKLTAPTEENEP